MFDPEETFALVIKFKGEMSCITLKMILTTYFQRISNKFYFIMETESKNKGEIEQKLEEAIKILKEKGYHVKKVEIKKGYTVLSIS